MSLSELKKLVGNKKLILGNKIALKELKKGEVKEIFLASNIDKKMKETIDVNAKVHNVKVSLLDATNDELGVIVKKPFTVSVISLLK